MNAGGSSAGAAICAAAGVGPIHQGPDGAGSIRMPAGFCGVFGLKPSYGRVPYFPVTNNDHMSHVGPITRTVADAALTLQVMKEADEKFDNDKFAEAYVLTSEKLKPAVDALPTLRTVPDHRQGLTQAWQTWFDAKTTLREAEDALLRAQRTWDEAKVEYERVQTERVQKLLDAVGAPSNPAGRAA